MKKKIAIHGAIDDATGDVVGLYMAQNECLFGFLIISARQEIWWTEDFNLALKFLYELFFEKQQSAS